VTTLTDQRGRGEGLRDDYLQGEERVKQRERLLTERGRRERIKINTMDRIDTSMNMQRLSVAHCGSQLRQGRRGRRGRREEKRRGGRWGKGGGDGWMDGRQRWRNHKYLRMSFARGL
jgi:hypothetical protein